MKAKKIIAAAVSVAMLIGSAAIPQIQVLAAEKLYETQQDFRDSVFQYRFAGGTDEYMSGASERGRVYDAYLWVPHSVEPGKLRGLVAVKANLIEVPFVESEKLRNALEKEDFGILWIVFQKDSYRYNNTFNSFNTRNDYAGRATEYTAENFTTDGKDAADIMNDILSGIADKSGYSEIKDKTPLITIGHSAASPFGYRSGNWNPNRIIAQVHMKNGMSGNSHMVPGIPSLQYAAQYTEHDKNKGRDRSVVDARWHIENQRKADTNVLVSHIIEWGSGHYDWSDNATDMMVKYIHKAIEYRLPSNYEETGKLNDLTDTGYLMKPFEKTTDGKEREVGYYKSCGGWLSSGQDNRIADTADKKESFWYFDEDFANEVNSFTNYAIPPSPDSNTTKTEGATYSETEPYMLMKNPSLSAYADNPATPLNLISPMTPFNADMSRYGSNRFVNYTRMTNPSGNASNSANLQGYDTATVDTYYMNNIPSITTNKNVTAYDGAGEKANVPKNTKAELVPLMAPYEIVSSELIDTNGMDVDETNSEAKNVASVTRTTLRFHNNRVYCRAGNLNNNEYKTQLDSFGMILSPEIKENGKVISSFKATGVQMNVPYTGKGSQTLVLDKIPNVNITDPNAETSFDVSYTSSDSDLQKYTDVFVEYGPARAVREVSDEDGSYSWRIEILKNEIPQNAKYPIEVNVIASNLGKWEKVSGATAEQVFYITDREIKNGVYLDGEIQASYDTSVNRASADDNVHTITVYSDSTTAQRSNMDSSENITFINGEFAAEVKQTSNNMMFLNTNKAVNPVITFGKAETDATNKSTALTFNSNGRGRFAEINNGTLNLHNSVIIKGGNAARGGGIDCKTGSTLNMYGGIIAENKATNSDSTNLGGGGISVVGYGIFNMYGGTITSNTSDGSFGGGVSVTENGTFNMSGGRISGNTGYDVYVKNNNMKIGGSAKIGSLYLAENMKITVNAPFTSGGSHAEITPAVYGEGTAIAEYADGVVPSTADFSIAPESDETAWYTYIDGQTLRLTATRPFNITANNVSVRETAAHGETVKVILPENYVENSLVVSGINPNSFIKISDKEYTFVMPEKDVTVSCLTNTDPSKVIVVGTSDAYFVKDGNSMNVIFDIPSLNEGYVYKSAEVKVPVRANEFNAKNMRVAMNGESYSTDADISLNFTEIKAGEENILTITNENEGGVDYYSYIGGWNGSKYDYPITASNLSVMVLTKSVYASAKKLEGTDMSGADINADAGAWYIENLKIPEWNPTLKWQIKLNNGMKAETETAMPILSGGGAVNIGLVLYGNVGEYTASDVKEVNVIE